MFAECFRGPIRLVYTHIFIWKCIFVYFLTSLVLMSRFIRGDLSRTQKHGNGKACMHHAHSSSATLVLVGVMEDGAGWEVFVFFFFGGEVWKKKYKGKKKRVRMEPARRKEHMPPPWKSGRASRAPRLHHANRDSHKLFTLGPYCGHFPCRASLHGTSG